MIQDSRRSFSPGAGAMSRFFRRLWVLALMLLSNEWLLAGPKPAKKLVNVADTRLLEPGFTKWVADLYNANLWLYGLFVVGIMVLMGVVLGYGFDKLINTLGINLGKLEHHE